MTALRGNCIDLATDANGALSATWRLASGVFCATDGLDVPADRSPLRCTVGRSIATYSSTISSTAFTPVAWEFIVNDGDELAGDRGALWDPAFPTRLKATRAGYWLVAATHYAIPGQEMGVDLRYTGDGLTQSLIARQCVEVSVLAMATVTVSMLQRVADASAYFETGLTNLAGVAGAGNAQGFELVTPRFWTQWLRPL